MEITQKSKLMQFFCRHKEMVWYKEKSDSPFSALNGERHYHVCTRCGKVGASYFAECEGMGFK